MKYRNPHPKPTQGDLFVFLAYGVVLSVLLIVLSTIYPVTTSNTPSVVATECISIVDITN